MALATLSLPQSGALLCGSSFYYFFQFQNERVFARHFSVEPTFPYRLRIFFSSRFYKRVNITSLKIDFALYKIHKLKCEKITLSDGCVVNTHQHGSLHTRRKTVNSDDNRWSALIAEPSQFGRCRLHSLGVTKSLLSVYIFGIANAKSACTDESPTRQKSTLKNLVTDKIFYGRADFIDCERVRPRSNLYAQITRDQFNGARAISIRQPSERGQVRRQFYKFASTVGKQIATVFVQRELGGAL